MNEQTNDPLIGRLLDGRYQVRSRIARGGMATVYLATDLRLERRVAVKVMHGHLADDAQFTQRFIQEARSAARLAHPNVVNVFDQGQDGDMAYLVMEYLPGITLRDLLREHKALTSEQSLDIMEAVLSGLSAAHKAGIVHRDLKPENVLLADDGRIKIGDFGLARAASANTATGAALLGTIAYLSPELVTRGVADTRSDIYAVGIMMYEMLVGEQPFKGAQPMQIAYQHANDSVPSPSSRNPRVPAELDELVLWATARDPDHRPRDARVMLEQLTDTQAQLSTAIPTQALASTRTAVLPSAPLVTTADTDAETQVLGGAPASPSETGPVGTEATTLLTRSSDRRRTRGRWLVALVLLLAAVAGGTGWYFGPGPGGHVTVPAVTGSPDAARASLIDAGLTVAGSSKKAYSLTVAEGDVVRTSPSHGAIVARGATVTLTVSLGPKPITTPSFAGRTLEDATALATGSELGLVRVTSKDTKRFTQKYAAGEVIYAFGTDPETQKTIKLVGGTDYWAGSPIWFEVSAGAVPDVSGETFDAASDALKAVDLTAVRGVDEFSDDVPKDHAIRVVPTSLNEASPIVPGDQVLVIMSKGPDVVEVPTGIVGQSINDATDTLKGLGFAVKVDSNVPQMLWNQSFLGVQKLVDSSGADIAEGSSLKRGSTITLYAHYG